MTVHREQGATSDRTHYLAEGGGRELAYVALSRARDRTTIYAVADGLDQAIDDITYDWSTDRHQQWTTETHEPATEQPDVYNTLDKLLADLADLAGASTLYNSRLSTRSTSARRYPIRYRIGSVM